VKWPAPPSCNLPSSSSLTGGPAGTPSPDISGAGSPAGITSSPSSLPSAACGWRPDRECQIHAPRPPAATPAPALTARPAGPPPPSASPRLSPSLLPGGAANLAGSITTSRSSLTSSVTSGSGASASRTRRSTIPSSASTTASTRPSSPPVTAQRVPGLRVTSTSHASRPHARTRPRTCSREPTSSQSGHNSPGNGGSGPLTQCTCPHASSSSSPGISHGRVPSQPVT
jgi:hypothetical protein